MYSDLERQLVEHAREIALDPLIASNIWKKVKQSWFGIEPDENPEFSFLPLASRQLFYHRGYSQSYTQGVVASGILGDVIEKKAETTGIETREFQGWLYEFWARIFSAGPFLSRPHLEEILGYEISGIFAERMEKEVKVAHVEFEAGNTEDTLEGLDKEMIS